MPLYEEPLFDERIEACNGPVVPPVYGTFKEWAWKPIVSDPPRPELSDSAAEHLNEIMEAYGGMSAYDLERLTHSESP